ncbi:T9SS type A sorting domain-containing protein [Flavobacterium silvaticum]|uniref:T9SS type A sorting domain-containing protein n=1 Tax=Flavobacterium silvaticum TaxID=1852020 RepID=A0A972FTE4_9FLAO|nr:T9SS type A sorting domain-containing protein [Flavobacterium silvaticum]NMH27215.1 T9SS type A sorting domain-containing protein [Flavobacterium silvaticum]
MRTEKKDLIITQNTNVSGSLCWIKNLGSGFFGAKQDFATSSAYTGFTIGDMNNDGKDDIIVDQLSSDYLSYFRNDGAGNFTSFTQFFNIDYNIYSIEFADLDQNNSNDLILSTGGSSSNNNIFRLENVNDAFTQSYVYTATATPYIFTSHVVDFDNDGLMDVVTNSSDCSLYWFKNFGANVYSSLNPIGYNSCANGEMSSVGDLNLDGYADLIYFKNNDLYWRENFQGTLADGNTTISIDEIPDNIQSTTLVDIDNDGDLDLFYRTYGEFGWFKNNAAELSVPTQTATKLTVFPNPAKNTLNITAANAFEAYTIVDVTGKVVARQTLSAPAKNQQIDLGSLSSGLYFLEIQSGTTKSAQKFVKN